MKRIFTGKIILSIALMMRVIFAGSVSASHTMGADLTYECIGNNTYKITVSFYRDCIGIPAPANPLVTVKSATCNQNLSVTCYPRPGTGQEVTPSCSSSVTTCNGGTFTGIQEWIYDGIITLPAQCTDWTFGYSLCCRNAAITTINNPSSSTFYIYASLNNTISPCNSSPTFSNKPVPFLCLGQQFCFNHGAYDADGDSLVYSLITPKQTATTNVQYHSPYTANNPLNSSPSTTFSSSSGDICLTPQALEVTVMAVLVKEYRNGVLIGTVERDLQLTVMNCANNLPTLSGINGTNNYSLTICANQQTCFNLFSNDPDNGQHLTVNWDFGIPAATFNSSAGVHPTGTFCWTPTTADIGHSYSFTATVTDDACPYNGSQTHSYTINVMGIDVDAGPDQSIACSDLATITANASGGSGTYTYLWNNGSTMQSITVGPGTYWVTANDGTCSATDTVVIDAPFSPVANFTATTPTCANLFTNFFDQSTTPTGTIVGWHWSFGDGDTSSLQNPVHQYPSLGNYQATLIVESSLGCFDTITLPVAIQSAPTASFAWSPTCENSPVTFADLSTGSPVSWAWTFGDGGTSTNESPTYTYTAAGTYTVTLITANSSGCVDTAVNTITVHTLPVISAGPDKVICSGKSVTVTASGGQNYLWLPSGQTTQTISFTPASSTSLIVNSVDVNGCTSADTMNIVVNPLPAVNAGADKLICMGTSTTLTATGAVSYTWNPGGVSGSSISVSPAGLTTYSVTGTDANGCSSADAVNVNVGVLPVANAGPDKNICGGQSVTLTATGGGAYLWSPGGMTTASITVSPASTQTYQVTITNPSNCTSTDAAVVNVNAHPSINLQSAFLCAGSNTTLDAGNTGSQFLWNTGATSQTIQVNSGGNYSVTVTDVNGCSATSSCSILYSSVTTVNMPPASFCQGDSILLDAGYSGMTYSWSPGGQTTQTVYANSTGSYVVTVTDTAGCSGNISFNISTNPAPVPNFSFSPTCQGNTMFFTNASSISSGVITGWLWNFGDGTTSLNQNPSHLYAASGNYNVTLTVTSASGCSSTITNPVTVNPLPVPSFSPTASCIGSGVNFINSSTVSSGVISGYNWDFGDGSGSTAQNPTHNYAASGNYSLTLQVMTSGGCVQTLNQNLTVHPSPVASFAVSNVCLGNAVNFSNNSSIATGSITSYYWDFNDTYTSTQSSPSHIYSTAGIYSVQLIVTSSFGCIDTVNKKVRVYDLPVAYAGTDQTICTGTSAVLTASGGTSYSWLPGNSSAASITVSPSSTTTYSVIVTDANGCTSSDAVNLYVNSLPNAQAGVDQSVCAGGSTTLSGTGGLTYSWNPGGSTSPAISVNPASTTNYILTVTDANGCIDKDTVTVIVHSLPSVSAGPDKNICIGSTTSLTATGAANYQWNPVGLNSPTILITPAATTTYTVIGTDVYGCVSSDMITVNVQPVPVVNLYPVFICPGMTATLDAGNPGSQFSWSTGESAQAISVSDSGYYSVIVTSPNGCPTFANTTVTVGAGIASAPVQYTICSGQSATLNAGNAGSTYSWSTGATSQTISVAAAGNYSVTITDANGCGATINHIVSVNPLPTGTISVSQACSGNATIFTQSAAVSGGTIQGYLWNFGDGITSSSQNTNHIYASAGNYPVSLTVTSNSGCTSTITGQAIVHSLPVADFSTSPTCRTVALPFSNLSSVTGGTLSGYTWSFGDGSNSTSVSPAHQYAASGTYNVSMTATTSAGCSASVVHSVSVLPSPDAAFAYSNSCENKTVQLTNTSQSQGAGILSYQWYFGNGSSSTSIQPSVNYAASGNYQITLTVSASNGCFDSEVSTVSVFPVPVASFNVNPACQGSAATFSNTSTTSSGTILNSYWTFGDNGNSSAADPSHTYTASGNFTATLIVTSSLGCSDTITNNVSVYPVPQPVFSAASACSGIPVTFSNSSTISSGTISSYQWNFSDGNTSFSVSPSNIYSSSGSFNVTLTATSDHGCSAASVVPLNIYPVPVPAFTTADVCLGSGTQFVNQSSVSGGEALSHEWTFDDGGLSTTTSPVHTFTTSGNHTIGLEVTTTHGCRASLSQMTAVHVPPVARFSAPDNCSGAPISFTNTSSSQDGNITSSLWSFGDGTTSLETNPIHMYSDSGDYNVELMSITNFGCTARFADTVEAFSHPTVSIAMNNACAGSPVQFSASSNVNTNMQYSWNVANSHTFNASSFSYTFATPGSYNVMLTATSSLGCSGSIASIVQVYSNPVVSFATNETCLNSPTYFSNQSSVQGAAISSYSWSFGDNQQSTQFNPPHTYAAAGTYNAVLTAVSDKGCSSSVTKLVEVHPNPNVTFNAGMQGCAPVNAAFVSNASVTSGNVTGWLWNFGDGEISTDAHPLHVFDHTGNYDVTLTVVSDFGCQASYTQSDIIKVFPQPLADFTADPMVADIQTPIVHFDNNSQNYVSYQWNFGDGTTTSTELNPVHAFNDTGTYTAMLVTVNNYGCRDTIMKRIEVKLHSTLFAANCFTPNGDGNNDVFRPYHTNMEKIQVWIFDRWGKLLTSWDGLDGSWDGYYQGRKCQEDTYVYKIAGTGLDGKQSEWVGHVSIVY